MNRTHPYGDRAARHAADLARRETAVLDTQPRSPVSFAPVGAAAVVVLGVWLWAAKLFLLLPYSGPGWDTALRDEGIAVVVLLAGLRLCWRPRSTPAAGLVVLAGLGLVVLGLVGDHDVARAAVNEIVTGVAVVLAACVARLAP